MRLKERAARVLQEGLNTYPGPAPIADQLVEVLPGRHRDVEAAIVREMAEAGRTSSTESDR
jgi:hypothetical protein